MWPPPDLQREVDPPCKGQSPWGPIGGRLLVAVLVCVAALTMHDAGETGLGIGLLALLGIVLAVDLL